MRNQAKNYLIKSGTGKIKKPAKLTKLARSKV